MTKFRKGDSVKLRSEVCLRKSWYSSSPERFLTPNKIYKIREVTPAGIVYFDKTRNLVADTNQIQLVKIFRYCI